MVYNVSCKNGTQFRQIKGGHPNERPQHGTQNQGTDRTETHA